MPVILPAIVDQGVTYYVATFRQSDRVLSIVVPVHRRSRIAFEFRIGDTMAVSVFRNSLIGTRMAFTQRDGRLDMDPVAASSS